MKQKLLTLTAACAVLLTTSCSKKMDNSENPFMQDYTTEYEIPPFDQIKYEHYIPAIKAGIEERNQEIAAITNNRAMPDFDNTILALDNSGKLLTKVSYVFYALSESDNTPEMEKISEEAMPLLTAAADEFSMNEMLFERIKQVYDRKDKLNLTTAQERLLDKYYKSFTRNGALLSAAEKDTLKSINQQLANYELAYNSNILKETNESEIVVENEADLAGIPAATVAEAAEEAKRRGKESKWVFTVHAPSRLAVLSYADNRDLRRRMYETYTSLASNDNKYNNSENINRLLELRAKKAKLLGFESFAAYQMDDVMAKTVENAENLLYQIWRPAVAKVKE